LRIAKDVEDALLLAKSEKMRLEGKEKAKEELKRQQLLVIMLCATDDSTMISFT